MKKFWKDALIRALRTFCQVLVTLIGTEYVSIIDIDWLGRIEVALTAAIVSILTSVATGLPETNYRNELESLNTLDNECMDNEHEVE